MEYSEIIRHIIHYSLHFVFPFIVAYFLFKKNWKKGRSVNGFNYFNRLRPSFG
ncbi:MAG: DUF6122 family protein [Patescibacteria group bacterium]